MAQPSLYFPPDLDQHFGERLTFYLGSILSKGVLVSNLLFSLSADDTTFAFFLTKGLNERMNDDFLHIALGAEFVHLTT